MPEKRERKKGEVVRGGEGLCGVEEWEGGVFLKFRNISLTKCGEQM